jgi:hypothetical protein
VHRVQVHLSVLYCSIFCGPYTRHQPPLHSVSSLCQENAPRPIWWLVPPRSLTIGGGPPFICASCDTRLSPVTGGSCHLDCYFGMSSLYLYVLQASRPNAATAAYATPRPRPTTLLPQPVLSGTSWACSRAAAHHYVTSSSLQRACASQPEGCRRVQMRRGLLVGAGWPASCTPASLRAGRAAMQQLEVSKLRHACSPDPPHRAGA